MEIKSFKQLNKSPTTWHDITGNGTRRTKHKIEYWGLHWSDTSIVNGGIVIGRKLNAISWRPIPGRCNVGGAAILISPRDIKRSSFLSSNGIHLAAVVVLRRHRWSMVNAFLLHLGRIRWLIMLHFRSTIFRRLALEYYIICRLMQFGVAPGCYSFSFAQ